MDRIVCLARAALLAAAAAAPACVSVERESPDVRFFVLEAVREGSPRQPEPGALLEVRAVRTARRCEGREFVYRQDDLEHAADYYNRFFVLPGAIVGDELAEWLRGAGVSEQILAPGSRARPTHALETAVLELHGDFRDPASPRAVTAIEFVLLDGSSPPRILLRSVIRREVPLAEASPQALARGWSAALSQVFSALEEELPAALALSR